MLGQAISWWLVIQLLSLVTLPIALSVFARLPGRGYAFARPFSLLLGGYVYWLVLSTHVLPNRPGSVAWVFILLAVVSTVILSRRKQDVVEQFRDNLGFIIAVEVVFAAMFFTVAHLKSFVPEIVGTEKPMDFMFINAASRSRYFPPDDPWLGGFKVSYYYFGYVIQAMVGKLAFLPTAVTFNLALASTAALAGTAAFGIGYEMARLARRVTFQMALAVGVAALVLVTLLGNLEGALEFGIANGNSTIEQLAARADIANLDTATESDACLVDLPSVCLAYPNEKSSFWWWWRATRISTDGNSITEFPFFSFLLGDVHPHVMAIPFVFTVMGLGLALFGSAERLSGQFWRRRPLSLLISALMLGGLGFLNTWDLPTFGFLLALLVLGRNLIDRVQPSESLKDSAGFLAPLVLLAFLLYLPFYLSFGTQADGFEAVRSGATRPIHSLLFWAPLFSINLPLPLLVLSRARDSWSIQRLTRAMALPAFLLLLWAVVIVTSGYSLPDAISARGWNWLTTLFLMLSVASTGLAFLSIIEKAPAASPDADDLPAPVTPVQPTGVPWHGRRFEVVVEPAAAEQPPDIDRILAPVLAMMATAFLLVLGGELFYVRDVFNSRLNTVFKLSYQAWLLLGVSGAFSLYWLLERWRPAKGDPARIVRGAWATTASLILAAAMLYPLGATLSRTEGLARPNRSLDGLAFVRRENPEEAAALDWLKSHADPGERLVEGTGGQYSLSGRMAAWSGIPTAIGWAGHEVQWGRGDGDVNPRLQDVDRIYTSPSLGEALPLLQKYSVTYVMVGSVENAKYPADGLKKFQDLTPTFRLGNTSIYRVPVPVLDAPEGE